MSARHDNELPESDDEGIQAELNFRPLTLIVPGANASREQLSGYGKFNPF